MRVKILDLFAWLLAIVLFFAFLSYATAQEVNLPPVCSSAAANGQAINTCGSAQTFQRATPTSLVRACASAACAFTDARWKAFGEVAATEFVEVCTAPKLPSDPINGGNCQGSTTSTWGAMAKVAPSAVATAAVEPEAFPGTFEVTPSSGVAPLTVTITWDVPGLTGATPCVASGSWSGVKATKGSQTVTNLTADASYKLDCTKPGETTGQVTLSWKPPTINTDGTALTNLAGYRIVYGRDPEVLSQVLQAANPSLSAYILDGLAAGVWYFAVKTYTTTGTESDPSNIASKNVVLAPAQTFSATRAVDVDVDTKPLPPTELKAVDVLAYEIRPNSTGVLTATRIGLVPLGTKCLSERQQRVGTITYTLVSRAVVDVVNWPANLKLQDVWVRCG